MADSPVCVVISQPMFFPWLGMFEQIRLADVYVHYSDVQFSKGSFTNRVQVKTAAGMKWLTVPLKDFRLGQRIEDVQISQRQDWRRQHLELLGQAYAGAPYVDDMLGLVEGVYAAGHDSLDDLGRASMAAVCDYFDLAAGRRFLRSQELGVAGASSRRVLDIVKVVSGSTYITGWGARNYLDHSLFESEGVRVEYMDYRKLPYPQLHGEFTPFVSALDLVANCGREGGGTICSNTIYWKEFING
jgi:hypothetical protein